jgi:uncharacterized spore protein YtfJ
MNVQQVMEQARDVLTVKRVFGEPYEKDGLTVIPVARVVGGGGGGEGRRDAPAAPESTEAREQPAVRAGSGFGVGYGVSARPAGVYVIRYDQVRWVPAVDVNRIILGAQVVAIVFLLVVRSMARSRAAASRVVGDDS